MLIYCLARVHGASSRLGDTGGTDLSRFIRRTYRYAYSKVIATTSYQGIISIHQVPGAGMICDNFSLRISSQGTARQQSRVRPYIGSKPGEPTLRVKAEARWSSRVASCGRPSRTSFSANPQTAVSTCVVVVLLRRRGSVFFARCGRQASGRQGASRMESRTVWVGGDGCSAAASLTTTFGTWWRDAYQ